MNSIRSGSSRLLALFRHDAFWKCLAGVGGLVFILQAVGYITTLRSILDEGLYLYKGYLFATQVYQPFQDYGVLTNHTPLSFLIPGYIQAWFGPGLAVGRAFSVMMGVLGLAGLWVAARTLGGDRLAALAVWAVALNMALVKIFSVGFSQVLVSTFSVWAVALIMHRSPRAWHLALGGFLAALVLLTRINMLPILLLVPYALWQHGWRRGHWALTGAALPFVGVHALYWPGILKLWAYWIPQGWLPFLEPFYTPWQKFSGFVSEPISIWIRDIDHMGWNPHIAFWHGMRFNVVAVLGVAGNLLLGTPAGRMRDRFRFRAATLLTGLFLILFLMHMWAALTGRSCHFFCFSGYIGFFNALGLLALVAGIEFWVRETGAGRLALVGLAVILLATGLGFGSFEDTGRALTDLAIPRLGGEAFPLWGLFQNKLSMEYRVARRVLPTLAGLLLGLALVGGGWLAATWQRRGRAAAYRTWSGFLLLAFVFSPTVALGGGDETLDCGGNVPAAYAQAGAALAERIPAGSAVYYHAGNSPLLLLYLEDIAIFPPQLNNVFSFSNNQNPALSDTLLRFGYWDAFLQEAWKAAADVILVEARNYSQWQSDLDAGRYEIVYVTAPLESCRGNDSQVLMLLPRNAP